MGKDKPVKNKHEESKKLTSIKDGPLTAEEQYELEKRINAKMRMYELEAAEKEQNSLLEACKYKIG